MAIQRCPSPVELAAFSAGRVPESEAIQLGDHVDGCPNCQALLETAEIESTALVAELRGPADNPFADETDCARAVLLARAVKDESSLDTTTASVPQVPFDRIGGYRLLEKLGAGGMGVVYKAVHEHLGKTVALKVLPAERTKEAAAARRFLREMKAVGKLEHPNIVRAYDAGVSDGTHYLVMECLEGIDLGRVLKQSGRLPIAEACELVRQAALGLEYGCAHGLVHRDLKPSNLMLTPQGQIKILDYGLARFMSETDPAKSRTEVGIIIGSPDYMAPEQARDARQADIRADIYGLGCTLYQLLAGQVPFPGGSAVDKLSAHLHSQPAPLATACPGIPAELVQVVERMMAKEPENRYQTPAEVAQALLAFCQAPPTAATAPQPRRRIPVRPTAMAACLALVVSGLLFGAPVFRFVANLGVIAIESDDPDVEVIVKRGGEQIRILDTKTNREITLRAGEYQLELSGGSEGLRLATNQFTLYRGGKQIVRVWQEDAQPKQAAASPKADELSPTWRQLVGDPTWARFAEAFFRRHDKNGDGHLDAEEMPPNLRADREKWDADRDGFINRDEAKAHYLAGIVETAKASFHRSDNDGDGRLLADEMPPSLRADREKWDTSRDGLIDLDEYSAYYFERSAQLYSRASGAGPAPGGPAVRLLEIRRLVGHRRPVNGVAVSPDGRLMLSGSDDKTARLWDTGSGKEVRRFNHAEPVLAVAFDVSRQRALTASGTLIRLFDVASGAELGRFAGHTGAVQSVAFSTDGRQVVSGSQDTTVRVWDVEGERQRHLLSGHDKPVTSVAFSRDSGQVLSGSLDGTLQLWNLETGKPRRIGSHSAGIRSIALSPDGATALSGGEDLSLRSWDVATGELRLAFSRPTRRSAAGQTSFVVPGRLSSQITCVALSPDGRRVVSGDGPSTRLPGGATQSQIRPDFRVRLWDVAGGQELARSEDCGDSLLSVALSGDGRLAAAAGRDKVVRLFWLAKVSQREAADAREVPTDRSQLALEKDAPQIPVIVKQAGQLVTVLAAKTNPRSELKPGDYELELSEQAEEFRLGAETITLKAGARQTVSIGRIPPMERRAPAEITEIRRFEGHTANVERVLFSPDGRQALSTSRDNTVRVWEIATGREVGRFMGHSEDVYGLALSPDGRLALSSGGGERKDGKFLATDLHLRLWDVTTRKEVRSFSGHTSWTRGVAFSPDGRYALSGSADTTLRLWEVHTGRELQRFPHEDVVSDAAFSPDGRHVLSAGRDALVRLWDVETGQELRRFEGHTEDIVSVAFSPDGRLVLSGSWGDKTMRLWDAATGQQLRCLPHRTGVHAVAFSPDGRRALSGSGSTFDHCVRLWDLTTGRELGRFEGHAQQVFTVAFSPDGRCALSGSADRTVRLLKLPEPPGLPFWEVRGFRGHTARIGRAVFSPAGRHVLSCSDDQTLRLWDIENGTEVRQFEGHNATARGVAFSPDGRLAASATWGVVKDGKWAIDNSIGLWDVTTGKELRRLLGHTGSLWDVAFTPDGRQLLSASWDTTLRLWDVQSGRQLRIFEGHRDGIRCLALSADGRLALSGSEDRTVRLWDVATGRELSRLEGHTGPVWGAALSPDGRHALSCGPDRTMRLWDVESGRQLRLFPGHATTVWCVAFSPDGRHALSGAEDRSVRLWEVTTGHELGRFDGFPATVTHVVFSPDGRSALAGGVDGTIRLLKHPLLLDTTPQPLPSNEIDRVAKGDPVVRKALGDLDERSQLQIESEADDGWLLLKQAKKVVQVLDATASQTVATNAGAYQLELAGRTEGLRLSAEKLLLAKGGKQVVQVRRETKPARVEIVELRRLAGHRGAAWGVDISCDGRYALTGGRDATVRLWDIVGGKEPRRFEGHTRAVQCVALSPDNRWALSAGGGQWPETRPPGDLDIRLWDLTAGNEVRRFQGHTHWILSVTFSPDGRFALSGSQDKTVRLWNVQTGEQVQCFRGHDEYVPSVAFSPDGRWVVSAGAADGTARLWDTATGREFRRFEGHRAYVHSVAFSPDGRHVLTGSLDGTMRLWDRESGQLRRSFQHPTGVESVAFSPDGRRLLSASGMRVTFNGSWSWAGYDYCVRLWDAASGDEIGNFGGLPAPPHSLAFSNDGRFALIGGSDSTSVRLLWFAETDGPHKPDSSPNTGDILVETSGFDLPVIVAQPDKLVTVIVPRINKSAALPPGEYELELAGQPEEYRLSADKVTLTKGEKKTVSIREVPRPKPPHEITDVRRFEGHTAAVESVAFSPDGRLAVSGSQDTTVRLWDVATGKEIRRFEGNTQSVSSVAFSPNGRQALSAGVGGMKDGKWVNHDFAIRLWDVDTGKEVRRFEGHTDIVWIAEFSPDGSRILSCSNDHTIRLWDAKMGKELRQFRGHEDGVRYVAFAPNGRRALSGGFDATVRLWDVETGKELRRFEGHTEAVIGVAVSPDGHLAVSSAMDRSVRLWDVETGREIRSFSGCRTSEHGPKFSPDGRRILTGSGWRPSGFAGFDYCVRLRDVATGDILACFEGHRAPVVPVVFSPDGRSALSAGYDNTIRLLQLPNK